MGMFIIMLLVIKMIFYFIFIFPVVFHFTLSLMRVIILEQPILLNYNFFVGTKRLKIA